MLRTALLGLLVTGCAPAPARPYIAAPAPKPVVGKPLEASAAAPAGPTLAWRGDVLPMGTLVCETQASIQILSDRYNAPVLARRPPVPVDCVSTVSNDQIAVVRRGNGRQALVQFLNGRLRGQELWTEAYLPPRGR